MINKSSLTIPARAEETVTVDSLKGDVRVRGMLLSDRLTVGFATGYSRISVMLALCVFVVDEKGDLVPMFSTDEWELFGSTHYEDAMKLFDVASRLSDIGGDDAEKKSMIQNSVSLAA